jgi:hypothetical protein
MADRSELGHERPFAVQNLRHIRKAVNSTGRLLIVEMVLPARDTPHPGKMPDMAMLVWPAGQERTLAEYDHHLLSKGGFPPNSCGTDRLSSQRCGSGRGLNKFSKS